MQDQEIPGEEQTGLHGPGRGLPMRNTQNLKENILRKLLQQKNLPHLIPKHKCHQQQGDAGAKEQDGKTVQHLRLGFQTAYSKDLEVLQHSNNLLCRSQLQQHEHLLHKKRPQRRVHGTHGSQVDDRRGV